MVLAVLGRARYQVLLAELREVLGSTPKNGIAYFWHTWT
jgi:hypothetical protein